jgi:hypothetical protein
LVLIGSFLERNQILFMMSAALLLKAVKPRVELEMTAS